MLKYQMFAVWDDKAKAFMLPWFQPTDALAVRMFKNAVNDPQSQLFKNPEDYTLFKIGSWDSEGGHVSPSPALETICSALQVKA